MSLPLKAGTIVVGGGASGLYFSSLAPEAIVLEKGPRPGRKVLLTGGGECNLAPDLGPREIVLHYYEKRNFVSPCLMAHTVSDIRSRFGGLGVETSVREGGKVFPKKGGARDVVEALSRSGNIITECEVLNADKTHEGFVLETGKGEIECRNLVLATGGASYPGTGSDGSAWRIAKHLGHRIIPPSAALSRIKLASCPIDTEGISVRGARVTVGGKTFEGDLLFTANGISGPAAMNASRYVSESPGVTIRFADLTQSQVKSLGGKGKAVNAISQETALPLRLCRSLLSFLGEKTIAELGKADLNRDVAAITSFTSEASTSGLLGAATATRGGVDTAEIDRKTFESRIVPGLYVIGECLDVDGECGGFNLTFAFSSAHAAWKAIQAKSPTPTQG